MFLFFLKVFRLIFFFEKHGFKLVLYTGFEPVFIGSENTLCFRVNGMITRPFPVELAGPVFKTMWINLKELHNNCLIQNMAYQCLLTQKYPHPQFRFYISISYFHFLVHIIILPFRAFYSRVHPREEINTEFLTNRNSQVFWPYLGTNMKKKHRVSLTRGFILQNTRNNNLIP